MYHDAERRKEAAEINASLYALRECVRYRRMQREAEAGTGPAAHVHVPYRSSQLTRVLMECFVKEQASNCHSNLSNPSRSDRVGRRSRQPTLGLDASVPFDQWRLDIWRGCSVRPMAGAHGGDHDREPESDGHGAQHHHAANRLHDLWVRQPLQGDQGGGARPRADGTRGAAPGKATYPSCNPRSCWPVREQDLGLQAESGACLPDDTLPTGRVVSRYASLISADLPPLTASSRC